MTHLDPGAPPRHPGRSAAQPGPRPDRLTLPLRTGTHTAWWLRVTLALNARRRRRPARRASGPQRAGEGGPTHAPGHVAHG